MQGEIVADAPERLADFDMGRWSQVFGAARARLQLPVAPLYMLRHIGPSEADQAAMLETLWEEDVALAAVDDPLAGVKNMFSR